MGLLPEVLVPIVLLVCIPPLQHHQRDYFTLVPFTLLAERNFANHHPSFRYLRIDTTPVAATQLVARLLHEVRFLV